MNFIAVQEITLGGGGGGGGGGGAGVGRVLPPKTETSAFLE